MADIAALGLEVRSDQVEKGTRALDKMSGAAKRAEAAVNGFSSTSSGAASAASRLAAGTNNAEAGLERVAGAARQAQQSLRLANAAANDNIKAVSKFNTANIAAQFQDIAVSAQMGMGAFQIGLQQGTQLAAVIGMMENPLRGLGTAFMSVISPVSLLTIGLVSLSAAGLQMVDWPKRASQALIFLADNLKAIARYAATAAGALALIYAPSVIAGMVNLIAWMGRVSVAAISMGASFALANPATALVAGFAAAVIAANIIRDELKGIFGRDIVADAKNAVNWIIGAFVGGFNGIKAVWGSLPAAIGDIVYSTAQNVVDGIQDMVQKAVDILNNLMNKYALYPGTYVSNVHIMATLVVNSPQGNTGLFDWSCNGEIYGQTDRVESTTVRLLNATTGQELKAFIVTKPSGVSSQPFTVTTMAIDATAAAGDNTYIVRKGYSDTAASGNLTINNTSYLKSLVWKR
ncbi:phage tail length tape measure family protein [Brucella intermedia]|uniref:phage tail length tape measure family protein n=1 Tax=Brucella intermedia TaxID=94625 RepID=UPI000DE2E1B4|nr:phage tail length tape measure family protein [Brucella intermedia]MPR61283.1 hypothetical protein [Brucella intermedia]